MIATLSMLMGSSIASGASAHDSMVRPGLGIGKLRLGMTLKESRKALAQPLAFVRAQVLQKPDRRYIEYRSRDSLWTISVFGPRGRERLVRITSEVPRERTKEGVGLGTLVPTLPTKLRSLEPECRQGQAVINFNLVATGLTNCAIKSDRALTIFWGHPECAVPLVRYQGCPRVRVPVAAISVESLVLVNHELSSWYPDSRPAITP